VTKIREAAMEMWRIDTHAHLGHGNGTFEGQAETVEAEGKSLPQNEYRIAAYAARSLYGIDPGPFIREDTQEEISAKAAELRKRGEWGALAHAMDVAHIEKQIAFCDHRPEVSQPFAGEHGGRLSCLAYIDSVVNGDGVYPCPDHTGLPAPYYTRLCELLGRDLKNLDDYLDALDTTIDAWRDHNVVGLKTAVAYTSGLGIGSPSPREARSAFGRKDRMTAADERVVCNTGLRHAFAACGRNDLPVVIHTGFQIWGHSTLEQSNPMLLHNVLIDERFEDVTFVLLHGGNPYVGETTYLATMFPNVNIDFTWISWMSPARFKPALAEWIAVVPHDRFCWGSDSATPETICGIDGITREAIADVLEEMVSDRIIDERYAMTFIEYLYQKTPRRLFDL
jgi:hypothetical protein